MFVTKCKQLVFEGEWKESKDDNQFVTMIQKIQKENEFLKNYVMNLAKGSVSNDSNSSQGLTNVMPAMTALTKKANLHRALVP